MPRAGCLAAAFALSLLVSCSSKPEKTDSVKSFALPEGELQLQVPSGWEDQVRQPPMGLPPTIAFRAREGKQFMILVTPISRGWPEEPEAAKGELRQMADLALASARSQAVETEISLVEFQGASGPGYYFAATDRAPKPGEFKSLAQGVLRVQDLMVSFTVLMNDDKERVLADALAMLKSAVRKGNAGGSPKTPSTDAAQEGGAAGNGFLFELQDPGVTVSIPELPQIDMQPHPMASTNPALRAMGAAGAYIVSVKVTSSDPGMSAAECASSLSGSIKSREGLSESEYALRKSSDNSTFAMYYAQRNENLLFLKAHLFAGYGGTHCIETHITKANAKAEDVQGWLEGFPRARILSASPPPTAQAAAPGQPAAPAQPAPAATPGYQKTDAYFSVPRAPKGKIDLAAYAGRPVLVFLFREDCPSCQNSSGEVEILFNDYKSEGLKAIGLSRQTDRRRTAEFADEYGLTFPVGYNAAEAFSRFSPSGVPCLVLLDREHKVAASWTGSRAIAGEEVAARIEKVLRRGAGKRL